MHHNYVLTFWISSCNHGIQTAIITLPLVKISAVLHKGTSVNCCLWLRRVTLNPSDPSRTYVCCSNTCSPNLSVSLSLIARLMQCHHTAQIWMNASIKPHQLRERSKDPVSIRVKEIMHIKDVNISIFNESNSNMPFSSSRFFVTHKLYKFTFHTLKWPVLVWRLWFLQETTGVILQNCLKCGKIMVNGD